MANRSDGCFDRWSLFGSTSRQYVAWLDGTALGSGIFHDTSGLGLDAIYPTFFVTLVMAEVRDRAT
jgi:predicted branched-subunit amino acid permease